MSHSQINAAIRIPRQPPQAYNPIGDMAKTISDELWERAMSVADIYTQGSMIDKKPLDEHTMWLILEKVALNLSPEYWNDHPEAIADLYKLRTKFMPDGNHAPLKILAETYRNVNKNLPNPAITPANPMWPKIVERLKA